MSLSVFSRDGVSSLSSRYYPSPRFLLRAFRAALSRGLRPRVRWGASGPQLAFVNAAGLTIVFWSRDFWAGRPSFWTLVVGWALDLGRPVSGLHSKWNPFVWLHAFWRAALRLDVWMYGPEWERRMNLRRED